MAIFVDQETMQRFEVADDQVGDFAIYMVATPAVPRPLMRPGMHLHSVEVGRDRAIEAAKKLAEGCPRAIKVFQRGESGSALIFEIPATENRA